MDLKMYSDRELLEMYAPVLRFSGGENFHPMNVEDYVSGETCLYRTVKGKSTCAEEWKSASPKERLEMLGRDAAEDGYMRFIQPNFWLDTLPRFILLVEVISLVIVIFFGLTGLSRTYPILALDYADYVKMVILAVLVIAWPYIDADGKVHLALLLNLFGIFFFGTVFTVGFGILALILMAGLWTVYFVFRIFYSKWGKRIQTWREPLLHGISLLLVGLSSMVLGFALDVFGAWLGWFSQVDFAMPVIMTVCTLLFYSYLLIGNALEERSSPESNRPKEFRYIYAFLVILALEGLTLGWGLRGGTATLAYTDVTIVSLAGISLLWYLLDPLSVTRPGLLREENERRPVLGWDARVLLFITLALIIYLGLSLLVYTFHYQQIGDYIFAVILHFIISALVLLVTMGILGSSVPGYVLDVLSGLYNTDALKAKKRYDALLRQRLARSDPAQAKRYWYYGHVGREDDWAVLQYHYFYAFNDFRSTAGGMNNHEGDWECVNVFIHAGDAECRCMDRPHVKPFGVAYSQHYHGEFYFHENAAWAKNRAGQPSCHPIIYVALGSHANYPKPDVYLLALQFSGTAQRVVTWLEKIILVFRTQSRLVEKHVREVERAFEIYEERQQGGLVAQGDKLEGRSREFACGDGIRAGFGFDPKLDIYKDEFKITLAPPSTVKRRESNFNGKPALREDIFEDWAFEVITDETNWVRYKGLWGRRSKVDGESGPQGPKWDNKGEVRVRWSGREPGYFLEWLDVLLLDIVRDDAKPASWRRKALQQMTNRGGPLEGNDSRG